jgi:hypothetical protein
MSIISHPYFCKGVQVADTVTCYIADGLLTPGASVTDGLTTLPPALLFAIGLCLLPLALLIAFIKARRAVALTDAKLALPH